MLFKDYRKYRYHASAICLLLVGVVAVILLTDKTFNFVLGVGTLGLLGMLARERHHADG